MVPIRTNVVHQYAYGFDLVCLSGILMLMDNEQPQIQPTQQPDAQPSNNAGPSAQSNLPPTPPQPKKPKIDILLVMLLAPAVFVTYLIISFVVGDISAGALSGKAETGWGFLLAMILSPVALVLILVSVLRARKLKAKDIKIMHSAVLALIIVGLIIAISTITTHRTDRKDSQIEAQIKASKVNQPTVTYISTSLSDAKTLLASCKPHTIAFGEKGMIPKITAALNNSPDDIVIAQDSRFVTKVVGNKVTVSQAGTIQASMIIGNKAYANLSQDIANAKKNCPTLNFVDNTK